MEPTKATGIGKLSSARLVPGEAFRTDSSAANI
jgi:hypothetical protein